MPDRLWRFVKPPSIGASDEEQYRWRISVAISLMGGIVLIVLHSMWAMGAMPGFEGQGFVQKSEFQQLARDVRVSRKNTLRSAIVDIIKNACQAPPGPYRTTLINQKTALLSEWKDLTGTDFPAPDCKEMGL